ncbi:hypothetical protein [Nocardioides zeicaulis]|uniref:ECF transporter S component n=1 Tax=Nocardioides zeicaulis TaxID=1776857 RepID=A0ABV6DXS8_9ACTN
MDGPYDDLVRRLVALRDEAGQPSFGELASRVSRVRRERGSSPEAARVGRTTVYDAFRLGRQRIDADLIGDLGRALGATDEQADRWAEEARRARSRATVPASDPVPAPAPEAQPDHRLEPEPDPEPHPAAPPPGRIPRGWVVGVLLGSLLLNLLGRSLVDLLHLPVHLDMTGTACAAVVLGPWWGALVGLATNIAGVAVSGPESLLFAPVNVVGALLWGYGVRRFALARSVPRFFLLNLLVAAVCSVVAVPLIVTVDHGFSGHGTDAVTRSAHVLLSSMWASVAVSNVLTSVVDKLISGFLAMVVVESLPARVRASMSVRWLRLGGSAD